MILSIGCGHLERPLCDWARRVLALVGKLWSAAERPNRALWRGERSPSYERRCTFFRGTRADRFLYAPQSHRCVAAPPMRTLRIPSLAGERNWRAIVSSPVGVWIRCALFLKRGGTAARPLDGTSAELPAALYCCSIAVCGAFLELHAARARAAARARLGCARWEPNGEGKAPRTCYYRCGRATCSLLL